MSRAELDIAIIEARQALLKLESLLDADKHYPNLTDKQQSRGFGRVLRMEARMRMEYLFT